MRCHIRKTLLCCAVLVPGCGTYLPTTYYAPTASGGTFLQLDEPACPIALDWIRIVENGATFDIQAVRGDKYLTILLLVNSHKSNAPIVRFDLSKVSLRNVDNETNRHPSATNQVDFRRSPRSWPIEPLVVTSGGYYTFRYSDIEGIGAEKFSLVFPEISIAEQASKLPAVTFQESYGLACKSGK